MRNRWRIVDAHLRRDLILSGKVVDQSGANVAGAVLELTREGQSSELETTSKEDGLLAFSNIAPLGSRSQL